MLTKFPLYESLVADTTDKAIPVKQRKKLIEHISVMDDAGKELIFVLIKYHHMTVKNESELYNCEIHTREDDLSDLKWDLSELPNRLQQILLKFAEKEHHMKRETRNRDEMEIKMKIDQGIK
jgi:hypothetical protein